MKHLLMLAVALACTAMAQAADEWKLYFQNESIEIYYSYNDCHDEGNGLHQQKIFYRFVNKTEGSVSISFRKVMFYTDGKSASSDVRNNVVLAKGAQVEGDCNTRDRALYTFVKQLDVKGSELKKCELRNVVVNPVQ